MNVLKIATARQRRLRRVVDNPNQKQVDECFEAGANTQEELVEYYSKKKKKSSMSKKFPFLTDITMNRSSFDTSIHDVDHYDGDEILSQLQEQQSISEDKYDALQDRRHLSFQGLKPRLVSPPPLGVESENWKQGSRFIPVFPGEEESTKKGKREDGVIERISVLPTRLAHTRDKNETNSNTVSNIENGSRKKQNSSNEPSRIQHRGLHALKSRWKLSKSKDSLLDGESSSRWNLARSKEESLLDEDSSSTQERAVESAGSFKLRLHHNSNHVEPDWSPLRLHGSGAEEYMINEQVQMAIAKLRQRRNQNFEAGVETHQQQLHTNQYNSASSGKPKMTINASSSDFKWGNKHRKNAATSYSNNASDDWQGAQILSHQSSSFKPNRLDYKGRGPYSPGSKLKALAATQLVNGVTILNHPPDHQQERGRYSQGTDEDNHSAEIDDDDAEVSYYTSGTNNQRFTSPDDPSLSRILSGSDDEFSILDGPFKKNSNNAFVRDRSDNSLSILLSGGAGIDDEESRVARNQHNKRSTINSTPTIRQQGKRDSPPKVPPRPMITRTMPDAPLPKSYIRKRQLQPPSSLHKTQSSASRSAVRSKLRQPNRLNRQESSTVGDSGTYSSGWTGTTNTSDSSSFSTYYISDVEEEDSTTSSSAFSIKKRLEKEEILIKSGAKDVYSSSRKGTSRPFGSCYSNNNDDATQISGVSTLSGDGQNSIISQNVLEAVSRLKAVILKRSNTNQGKYEFVKGWSRTSSSQAPSYTTGTKSSVSSYYCGNDSKTEDTSVYYHKRKVGVTDMFDDLTLGLFLATNEGREFEVIVEDDQEYICLRDCQDCRCINKSSARAKQDDDSSAYTLKFDVD